ncbi:MAG: helix-turn-helix transcriptional regulator, partial [Oscillospiraceae bacterium]|nr:helix-turn-helix transcriptional regulator [Oscillospiraceae bacterium]
MVTNRFARKDNCALDTEQLQGSFRRGILPLIILSLLKTGDMYGYQLVQETTNRSGGAIVTQEGSLYPVLYRL